MKRILVLNYGGTSAKLAVFEDRTCTHELSVDYTPEEAALSRPGKEDIAYKKKFVMDWLDSIGLTLQDIDVYAPRLGATFYGGDGGTFLVEGALRTCVENRYDPERPMIHAIVGTLPLVNALQEEAGTNRPVYATDPASIDQFLPEARITGMPQFKKRSSFHALNQRSAAHMAAEAMGKKYNQVNLVVAHMGGGISVGAHEMGRIIDVNDCTGDGDGPFTPNRAGAIPAGQLVHLCFSGEYTEDQLLKILRGESGVKAYLGTDDLREVEKMIQSGDEQAQLIFNAMAYQIAREIGACYATLRGKADGIVMTGGMAKSKMLVERVSYFVENMAPVYCFPGAMECEALAYGALRVMNGDEELAVYHPEDEVKNNFAVSSK